MCVACISSRAVDVFAAFPASFDNRLSIMKEIGKLWKTWDSAAETLYPLDKPIYQDSVAGLKIGRIEIGLAKADVVFKSPEEDRSTLNLRILTLSFSAPVFLPLCNGS
ncbi:uncharacterized protein LOC131646251 isoform X2 [Vicia villosa]|nr:uncharacterized protein LOC131646251 isoform X2 [Vicia villosa]